MKFKVLYPSFEFLLFNLFIINKLINSQTEEFGLPLFFISLDVLYIYCIFIIVNNLKFILIHTDISILLYRSLWDFLYDTFGCILDILSVKFFYLQ